MPEKPAGQFDLVDPETFDRLYQEWSGPVYRYLVHLIGSGSATEDLFQDAWMKAIEYRQQLRDPARFGSWIFRIARNLALNHMRTFQRKAQIWIMSNLDCEGDEALSRLAANGSEGRNSPRPATPQDLAVASQRRQILQEALISLEPETQEMLQLRYFEQLGLAEVAEILDRPLGTVCTKVHRGLKSIRAQLEKMGHQSISAL